MSYDFIPCQPLLILSLLGFTSENVTAVNVEGTTAEEKGETNEAKNIKPNNNLLFFYHESMSK